MVHMTGDANRLEPDPKRGRSKHPGRTFLLLGLYLTLSCTPAPGGQALPPEVREPSGMARSPSRKGVFWVHSDSGNPPLLHAVDGKGRLVARARVEGSTNVDWEDIASHDGALYLADIGNNFQSRQDLAIFRVAEPSLDAGLAVQRTAVLQTIEFSYPEQERFPARRPHFDAEAIFWTTQGLWLLSKRRGDYKTVLYRVPHAMHATHATQPKSDQATSAPAATGPQTLVRVREFDLGGRGHPYGGMVTAADADPERHYLAVLSYHAIFIFDLRADPQDPLGKLVRRLELRSQIMRQCESITWDGADLLVTNEDGRLFRVPNALEGDALIFPQRAAKAPAARP